jgi:type IV secretory pathway VirB2 component (pilin)
MSIGMLVPALTSAFSKESIASLAAASAAISHALGLETEATAAGIATGATASFGTVLYSVLGPIALVVAAIAGLALGFKALSDAANADEIAAEKAVAAAE